MYVNVTTNDETGQVAYEVDGEEIRVIVEPSDLPGEVTVEIWDAAGCSAREGRPADQADSVALRTLFNEIRFERRERAEREMRAAEGLPAQEPSGPGGIAGVPLSLVQ